MSSTEKEKMLAGDLYWAGDPELVAERARCQSLLREYNSEPDEQFRLSLLHQILGAVGAETVVRSPFACDYGYNITLGTGVFLNFNTVILDCAPVSVGDRVQIGPAVQLLAADHPRDAESRKRGLEMAAHVSVGDDVWIGAGAIVCPGVTIGADTVIGAGSVVTRDIPAGVVAVGSPCRVIRRV
jgi:maltose O-acetyltransferase